MSSSDEGGDRIKRKRRFDESGNGSDEERRMAFTAENDFEGGQWIGGEFYARSDKRGSHRQTKEDQLYGVFADDSDEESARFRERKKDRRQGGGKGGDLTKPLNFVSGAMEGDAAEEDEASIKTEEKEDAAKVEEEQEEGTESAKTNEAFRSLLKKATEKPKKARASPSPPPPAVLNNLAAIAIPKVSGKPKSNSDFRAFLLRGLQSVEASTPTPAPVQDASADVKDEEEDIEEEHEAQPISNEQPIADVSTKGSAVPPQPRPANLDSKFGDWEKHTKGIGLKLMKKMGFTGRLGKHETGVTRQMEVKVRPGMMGLGFGDFKEATTLKVNREIEADRQGKTVEELEIELGIKPKDGPGSAAAARRKAAEQGASAGLWRKDASSRKRQRRYVTADELLQAAKEQQKDGGVSADTGVPAQQVILDMRGPTVRLLAGADEIDNNIGTSSDFSDSKPALGQELLHNVHLTLAMAEADMNTAVRRVGGESDRARLLERDAKEARKRAEEGALRLKRIEQVTEIVSRIDNKVASDPESVSPQQLASAIEKLRTSFPEEFAVFGLAQLVPALASPIIGRALKSWNPLESPMVAARLLLQWRAVLRLEGGDEQNEENTAPLRLRAQSEGEAAYKRLLDDHVMPPVRSALTNAWQVREPESAVSLVQSLAPVLPADDLYNLKAYVIIPKLSRALAQWNPKEDGMHIYKWIIPWASTLGSALGDLFSDIRRKLASALKVRAFGGEGGWGDMDNLAISALQPWAGVFDARGFEALLVSSVAPVLAQTIRENLIINPAQQDPEPFFRVLAWRNLLPNMYIWSILEGEFFPKWETALRMWLQDPAADLGEVAQWYQAWKSQFPDDIADDDRIKGHFAAALSLMDHVLRGVDLPPEPPLTSYEIVLQRRRAEAEVLRAAEARTSVQVHEPAPVHSNGGSVTFKEVVENFALENGIEYYPKLGRTYQGRPISTFGGISIYIDQSVVYAYDDTGGENWTPVALEDLLQKAIQKQARDFSSSKKKNTQSSVQID